jgi:succinate dehydrogenase (ubiquinone) membrane anchor subunit
VSAGLIPLTLAPFIGGSLNPLTDSILGATILIHSYIGFQACIVDYFPTYRVPKIQNALMWVLRLATVLTGIGFYEFETSMCYPFLDSCPFGQC